MRVGIASILQETNTFSIKPTVLDDFTIAIGEDVSGIVTGTNSELGGAIEVLQAAGTEIVPIVYAWAMPSGRVAQRAFEDLHRMLTEGILEARHLDALVLSLHGSMASEQIHDADGELLHGARSVVGPEVPIAISLDLHANVTEKMAALADSISAYHTDPHVDMARAGSRAATRAVHMASTGSRPAIGLAKRPMIIPAETMNTESGVFARIRREALDQAPAELVELCLFPVQPWLDVPELGFAVVAMTQNDSSAAMRFADEIASRVWEAREEFVIDRFLDPATAVAAARDATARPFLVAESADAPTAGAAGDSPAMVRAIKDHGSHLVAYVPIVDPAGVAQCHAAGVGETVGLRVGASIDPRWHDPVELEGVVTGLGEGNYRLEGASFTGMPVSMGRFASVASGGLRLLMSEKPAWTSDPATFRFAGLDPDAADVIVVRSCSDFRPNFPRTSSEAVTLDVSGAATPRLENLRFENLGRPPYPLDPWTELDR